MKVSFFGAAGTVTGSRFLLQEDGRKILVDCGLFQGPREWKQKNWDEFPITPSSIDAVILTHAHIDHAGYLPRLIQMGFRGPVYCTPATAELLTLVLPDSGHLQEEDASFANKKGYAHHSPALPLYTEEQARETLNYIRQVDFYKQLPITPDLSFSFLRAGHILGSAMVEFKYKSKVVVFSGDVGRPSQFITRKPDDLKNLDYLVLESTYGNRLHQKVDVKQYLAEIIKKTAARGGVLMVPAFAVGRTQELLYLLRLLEEEERVPQIPVYIDSPMAILAIPIYNRHQIDFSQDLKTLTKKDNTPFVTEHIHVLKSVQESMSLNNINHPAIIVSSSGMATGGRILHHLKRRIGESRNTVLFIGFQAEGTKGRFLVEGAKEIKIHGKNYAVHARIEYMDALSCHADYQEQLDWLTTIEKRPQSLFLVHGETSASASLAEKIRDRFGWKVHLPAYLEDVEM